MPVANIMKKKKLYMYTNNTWKKETLKRGNFFKNHKGLLRADF